MSRPQNQVSENSPLGPKKSFKEFKSLLSNLICRPYSAYRSCLLHFQLFYVPFLKSLFFRYFIAFRDKVYVPAANVLHLIEEFEAPSTKKKMYEAIAIFYKEISEF